MPLVPPKTSPVEPIRILLPLETILIPAELALSTEPIRSSHTSPAAKPLEIPWPLLPLASAAERMVAPLASKT
jgi:hypothetical protein